MPVSRLHNSMAVHFCSQPTTTINGYHFTCKLNKNAGSIILHTASRWMSWKRLCDDIWGRKISQVYVRTSESLLLHLMIIKSFNLKAKSFYILTHSHGLSFLSLHTILLLGSAFDPDDGESCCLQTLAAQPSYTWHHCLKLLLTLCLTCCESLKSEQNQFFREESTCQLVKLIKSSLTLTGFHWLLKVLNGSTYFLKGFLGWLHFSTEITSERGLMALWSTGVPFLLLTCQQMSTVH